jgi:hypothetical protein
MNKIFNLFESSQKKKYQMEGISMEGISVLSEYLCGFGEEGSLWPISVLSEMDGWR